MILFLLIMLIVAVCMLSIYFHMKKLAWKIDQLELQLQTLQKSLSEKTIN